MLKIRAEEEPEKSQDTSSKISFMVLSLRSDYDCCLRGSGKALMHSLHLS
jgi:hypothetical protein